MRILCCLIFVALCGLNSAWSGVVLRVNPGDSDAADEVAEDPSSRPFRTIAAAANAAVKLAAEGIETQVIISPGTYREEITLTGDTGHFYALIELRAAEGQVHIVGTDKVDGWRIGRDGYFDLPWNESMGEEPSIYVEGARVVFIPNARSVFTGQAMMSNDRELIQMLPPKNAVVKAGTVEVAVRKELFRATNLTQLRLKNLHFAQGRLDSKDQALVTIDSVDELIMEDCQIEHGSRGLIIQKSGGVDLNAVSVSRCQGLGASMANVGEIVIRGGEFILNGQQNDQGYGLFVSDVFTLIMVRAHIAENASGILLEDIAAETSLDSLTIYANRGIGLTMDRVTEAKLGQVQFAQNTGGALTLRQTSATLTACILADNGGPNDSVINLDVDARLQLQHSIIGNRENFTSKLLVIEDTQAYQGTGNLFHAQNAAGAFSVGDTSYDLDGWYHATGQDGRSHFEDPRFVGPERFDYVPARNSPWFNRSGWIKRDTTSPGQTSN